MAFYIDGEKYQIITNDEAYDMQLFSSIPITNGIRLLSSDDYILKDIKGLYLTIEYIESLNGIRLLSSEGYTLKDIKELYLTTEYIELLSLDGNILQDIENKYLVIKKG